MGYFYKSYTGESAINIIDQMVVDIINQLGYVLHSSPGSERLLKKATIFNDTGYLRLNYTGSSIEFGFTTAEARYTMLYFNPVVSSNGAYSASMVVCTASNEDYALSIKGWDDASKHIYNSIGVLTGTNKINGEETKYAVSYSSSVNLYSAKTNPPNTVLARIYSQRINCGTNINTEYSLIEPKILTEYNYSTIRPIVFETLCNAVIYNAHIGAFINAGTRRYIVVNDVQTIFDIT